MLKKTLLIIGLAISAGYGSVSAQEQFIADKVVAVVGNSAILYSDIVDMGDQILRERRERNYTLDRDPKSEALERLMLQKLLFNQAKIDSIEVQLNNVISAIDDHVNQMVREMGSVAAVEAHYKKPIYEIKDQLRNRYEEGMYAQRMQQEIQSKVKITPGEVERFYKKIDKDSLPIIPEQYVFAQITKFPSTTKEAKQRTRERLLTLRERILNGEKFQTLARMYSVDPGSAMRGGEMDPATKETFVRPFADALAKLKPGQVSEIVETEFGFHIIQLIDKKDNLYHARHILLRPTFTDEELAATSNELDSLVNLIRADSITFEKAALDNSDDKYSKFNGGLASNQDMLDAQYIYDAKMTTTKFLKEDLPPTDYEALRKLKVGDISDAYISQDMRHNMMSKVVKLVEVIPAHPASLKEDYLRLEELALSDKQDKEFQAWLKKKIASMYVRIEPEYRTNDFDNKAWLK